MSIPLSEALAQVDLQPDQSYHCRVRDYWVELRVHRSPPELEGLPLLESDIMLDPWVEFPDPAPIAITRPKLVEPEPPDLPFIPRDDEAT